MGYHNYIALLNDEYIRNNLIRVWLLNSNHAEVRTSIDFKLSVPPIWIYIPSDAQLSPHRLVYSKVYVDMENLFLF